MITPKNILFHELIGLDVLVVDASNKAFVGLAGFVVNETRNMIAVMTEMGERWVAKKGTTFRFILTPEKAVDVDGSVVALAPEKRINMRIRK